MKRLSLILLALCWAASGAFAGPNAGGTVILHWNSTIDFTMDPETFSGGLTDCSSANVEMPPATTFPVPPDSERRIWFAYAAFPPGSTPRLKGVAFGITYNAFASPDGVRIDWSLAPQGSVEIRTTSPSWPAPNSGTSLVFNPIMTGLVNQIYTFAGFGSFGQVMGLRTHPINPSQFSDDSIPAVLDDIAAYGSIGFGVPGALACPPTSGACCNLGTGECVVRTELECEALGDICEYAWMGPDVPCSPNPCPAPQDPPGACCAAATGVCRITTESECIAVGDWWQGACMPCEPNPCPLTGACCLENAECRILSRPACEADQGLYMGDGVSCVPYPCPIPTERTTWGRIKNNYR